MGRVLFLASNGVGMGHLARSLAIAKRLRKDIQPVIVTFSQAISAVHQEGFLAEYIPSQAYLKCDVRAWNHFLRQELSEMIRFYDARVLVFDGNAPYAGVLGALQDNPYCYGVWCRRAMWQENQRATWALEKEDHFEFVIEPGEIAHFYDRGLTNEYQDRTIHVDPIRMLDNKEMLSREEARESLGLPKGPLALFQLGAGNNHDFTDVRSALFKALTKSPGLKVATAEWLIADQPDQFPGEVITVKTFPIGKYLKAFDFVVSAAGYNSFHELILSHIPTVFVPNENTKMDDQVARAVYAEDAGLALSVTSDNIYKTHSCARQMLDDSFRAGLVKACKGLSHGNGAYRAAQIIEELVFSIRADQAQFEMPV